MIYQASQILAKLRLLTLSGKEDGQLEWIGKDEDWNGLDLEEESILRDYEICQS